MSVYFIDQNTDEFSTQISVFAEQLPKYSDLLGFDDDEKTEAVNDAAYMAWVVKTTASRNKNKLAWTAYENLTRNGSDEVLVLTAPIETAITAPPILVLPGVQKRYAQKAAKAKANPNCSIAIQKILDIYTTPPSDVTTPLNLRLKEEAGYPLVRFFKYGFVGINLYRDTGDGYGSKPYKTLTTSPFLDTDLPALGITARYKYKGIFVVKDVETGSFSPEVSINVVGR